MKKWLVLLFSTLLLFGCEAGELGKPSNEQSSPPVIDKQEISLLEYFPENPIEKSFLGKGNEFAQYTETFFQKEDSYFPTITDNGGTQILRIYKVTEQEISLVYEQAEFYESIPSLSTLEPYFQSKPILTLPLEEGKNIGEWKIVSSSDSITVPFGEFSDVIILENINVDGSIIRQYWAKKYGKIKDEFIIKDKNGTQFEVTSELQDIK
jgi:hypothetical protein